MLTFDYDRLGVRPGDRVLDAGCGAGRHSVEALRRGCDVVAVDRSAGDLARCVESARTLDGWGLRPPGARLTAVRADALRLPFADGAFDRVVAAEVLEHIPDDAAALAELVRVLRPGGTLAVTVPRWFPERVCWALSHRYHAVEGGHVRIYRRRTLMALLRGSGLVPSAAHHAHALHTPYWWLRCLAGVDREDALLPRLYHRFLVWDLMHPVRPVRLLERLLDPLMGKSLVVYLRRPEEAAQGAAAEVTSAAA